MFVSIRERAPFNYDQEQTRGISKDKIIRPEVKEEVKKVIKEEVKVSLKEEKVDFNARKRFTK